MNNKKITKRTSSFLLATLILAGSAAALPSFVPETGITVNAYDGYIRTYGDFSYRLAKKQIIIKGYSGSGPVVNIPSTIEGYPVTKIDSQAFYDNHSITKVTIPNGVETIGTKAFASCHSLKSITIPDSVTILGGNETYQGAGNLFSNCSSLESITIPSSVTIIPQNTFFSCTSLKTVTLPNTITKIGYNAFNGCSSLAKISIPASVTTIETSAFTGCSSLTIYGKSGTTAESYAESNGIPFIDSSNIAVTKVTLNKTSAKLNKGQSVTLTATVTPSNATNKTVTWKTSNSNVATVSGGKVKAVGKGTATIQATAGGKTASCTVTVTDLQNSSYVIGDNNSKNPSNTAIILVGSKFKLHGAATGGNGTYTYKYMYKRTTSTKWNYLGGNVFTTATEKTIKPTSVANFDIRIQVKDATGAIITKTFLAKATDLRNTSTVSPQKIKLGKKFSIKGSATGGTGTYNYTYEYKKSNNTVWKTLGPAKTNTASITFKPAAVGTYNFRVTVSDGNVSCSQTLKGFEVTE